MGFLLLSVQYPSESDKTRFVRSAGPHSNFVSPVHNFLAASATDDQWRSVLKAIRENTNDASFLDDVKSERRPLRPNDDNYQAFTGRKWKPKNLVQATSFGVNNPSIPPALSALLNQGDESTPYPHFDYCANCTKLSPKMNQCSRCRIVRYCSRECQSAHWKKVHKTSCVKAQPFSLYKCMNGNDGFHVSPEECRGLQLALSRDENNESDELIQCFRAYFDVAGDLGGCFVL